MHKNILLLLFITLLIASSCERKSPNENYYHKHQFQTNGYNKNKSKSHPITDSSPTKDSDSTLTDITFDEELPILLVSKPQQILRRVGYTTSYNKETKNANWVAWHLTKEHTTGPYKRDGIPYMVDEDITSVRQELDDWDNMPEGLSHGHMCPAGDNKWSKDAMVQSFLLTNMCPQDLKLNQGDWERLESRCRDWAKDYGDIYIVSGPIFYSSNYQTMGANKVGIPDAFFKVVLCLNGEPKALGFIYPNNEKKHKMHYYVTSVDKVEGITDIDFFSALPDNIENEIESKSNLDIW